MSRSTRASALLAASLLLMAGCAGVDEPDGATDSVETAPTQPTSSLPTAIPDSPTTTYEPAAPLPTPEYEALAEEVRILQNITLYDEDTGTECLLLEGSSLKRLEYPAVGGIFSRSRGYNVRSVYVDRNQELDVVGSYPECPHGDEVFISDRQWAGETGQLERVAVAA